MKKLLILTMMCVLIGSMVALESDPSEVVGYVKYECVTNANGDLNFIAASLDAGYTIASELGADYPDIASIRYWDSTNQVWVSSDNYGGGFWFPDNPINPNQPLFITVTAGFDLYFAGGLNAEPSYSLVTNANGDLNTIMLPFSKSDLTDTQLLGDDIGVCASIRNWDHTNQAWVASDNYGGGFWFPVNQVEVAQPYYVTVTSNVTWPSVTRENIGSDRPSKARQ